MTDPARQPQPRGKRGNNKAIYANPLPVFSTPEALPSWSYDPFAYFKASKTSSRLPTLVSNPECVGILDAASKSVWVVNERDAHILWQRGFFGKGSLSRSEPSWLTRRINQINSNAPVLTAEEVTAKRRAERTQFKKDRADAIALAKAEAEAVFAATGELPSLSDMSFIPSVNRPSRPAQPIVDPGPAQVPAPPPQERPHAAAQLRAAGEMGARDQGEEEAQGEIDPELYQMEHLQLTLQEAFFLSWSLGCLRILDPKTDTYLTPAMTLQVLLGVYLPFVEPDIVRRPDNPFLVNYAIYHYYRSLGWVVRGGIKFCVDYLLYKKGPVFHHAEFAVVVCPVYEDPEDEQSSPFDLPNTKPFTWSCFSTVNRVNSQVKKTFILAYVTIPSQTRLRSAGISILSPEALSQFSVREVVIRRFIPARMRD